MKNISAILRCCRACWSLLAAFGPCYLASATAASLDIAAMSQLAPSAPGFGQAVSPFSCAQGSALPDGCSGAPAGAPQLPHLLDVQQVTALSIIPGSSCPNGTFIWTASGGGGSGATGTVTIVGGALGGPTGTLYTISNQGSGYTGRPTISLPAEASSCKDSSIIPTVYQATPHNAVSPWNMPGVDYHAGIPEKTILKDPTLTDSLPAGARYALSRVTVTGCNVTLDGFDFTLHNTVVVVNISEPNCMTAIEGSKFQANDTALQPIALLLNLGANGSFVFRRNEYDGRAIPGGSGSGFMVNDPIEGRGNGGSISLLYNYFYNFDSKVVQLSGATPSLSFTEKYNLFADFGSCTTPSCAHGEADYTYGGGALSVTAEFNTFILHFHAGPSDLTAAHAIQADSLHIDGIADDHNVVFAQGPQNTCAQNNRKAYVAAAAYFDGMQAGGVLSNISFTDNYIDNSGAYFPWYHNGGTGLVYMGNVDAGSGRSCNSGR
jgi:hypothetical protein